MRWDLLRKLLMESFIYGALFFGIAYVGRLPLRDVTFLTPLRIAIVFAVLYFFYGWIRLKTRKERKTHKF